MGILIPVDRFPKRILNVTSRNMREARMPIMVIDFLPSADNTAALEIKFQIFLILIGLTYRCIGRNHGRNMSSWIVLRYISGQRRYPANEDILSYLRWIIINVFP